jgi:hypothetical protein
MAKRFIFIVTLLLFITGCNSDTLPEESSAVSFEHRNVGAVRKKPNIPSSTQLKANVLSATSAPDDTERLIKQIEQRVNQPNIIYQDIQRGWYYGSIAERKYGTPETWTWVEDGPKSRWVSPNSIVETQIVKAEELCKQTAGTYVISCIDTEIEGCEYIPENTCQCIQGSMWQDKQGCILTEHNEEELKDEFVVVTGQELAQGWYHGLPNEKKLDTPTHWIWIDLGQESRWQNPNPSN